MRRRRSCERREDPEALLRLALPGRTIVGVEADETDFQVLERRTPPRSSLPRPWFAKIRKETLMESTVFKEIRAQGAIEGKREFAARQLRLRLGKSRRTEGLVARLPLCSGAALQKVGDLLVGSKKKADLFAAIEKLLPEPSPK